MKRQLLILLTITAALVFITAESANAIGRGGRGGGRGGHGRLSSRNHIRSTHGGKFGHGFNQGFGFGGFDFGWDLAELYRELLNNVPYYALHPPVYYSYPVPRTYGYSPFAYPGCVMTPEMCGEVQPLEIINPYVPSDPEGKAASTTKDRTANASRQPEPLVIINPYVTPAASVARSER
jgi:hypothetical protein